MIENIIIKPSVQKRFDSFIAHGRVLFFSAPCGFGKTVLADALLRGRNVLRQSAADPDCAIPPSAQDWDILLIDDLQLMQEEAGQQALCELIRSSPERHFVLLSRGVPPGCLTAFQYTGLMTVLEADDLLFDADDVRRLLRLYGVEAADSEIDGILKESVGYPLGVRKPSETPRNCWTRCDKTFPCSFLTREKTREIVLILISWDLQTLQMWMVPRCRDWKYMPWVETKKIYLKSFDRSAEKYLGR